MSLDRPKLAVADIESWLDEIETPETSVTLCLKGKLVAEYERLDAQLAEVGTAMANLAGDGPGSEITARMAELREQMLAHMRTFTFRAVTPRGGWRKLIGRQPVKAEGVDADAFADLYHAWLCEMVSASASDPVMSAEQVQRLADKLSNGQWVKLANGAWSVNDDSQGIPFSVAASVLSRGSGEKSRQPEPSDNPDHDSLAGSPSSEPESSTTTEAGSLAGSPPRTRSGRTRTATS